MPSLDKKYRPTSFRTFIGNRTLIARLKELLNDKESFPSAMLFQGERGCGKTTLARIVAKQLDITNIVELNLGNLRGIDNARSIEENTKYLSIDGGGKVIIIDESHRGTVDFWSSMLKVLEEPPPNIHFILCTTNPEKLINTVVSRTKPPFQVGRLHLDEMKLLIKKIARKEKIAITNSVLRSITSSAEGIPRDALLILNSIKNIDDPITMIKFIKDGSWDEKNKEINELSNSLLKGVGHKQIMTMVRKMDQDPEHIRRGVLNYMSKVLLNNDNERAAMIMECFIDNLYNTGKAGLIYAIYSSIKGG